MNAITDSFQRGLIHDALACNFVFPGVVFGPEYRSRRHTEEAGCDRIFTIAPFEASPTPRQVSSGKGSTTCSHFFPDGKELLGLNDSGALAFHDVRKGRGWNTVTAFGAVASWQPLPRR